MGRPARAGALPGIGAVGTPRNGRGVETMETTMANRIRQPKKTETPLLQDRDLVRDGRHRHGAAQEGTRGYTWEGREGRHRLRGCEGFVTVANIADEIAILEQRGFELSTIFL